MASEILIIEDNQHDVFALKRAFEKAGLRNDLLHFERGDAVMAYLSATIEQATIEQAELPQLVLLDLMLPDMSGLEILRTIKESSHLRTVPVIIFSSSTDERDIEMCLRAGANSYIPKPITFHELLLAISRLKNYWFEIAVLPKSGTSKSNTSKSNTSKSNTDVETVAPK